MFRRNLPVSLSRYADKIQSHHATHFRVALHISYLTPSLLSPKNEDEN